MIIPAFNEEESIAQVIADIPELVSEVVVCNNNSTDQTKVRAEQAGATVVDQPIPGYGNACLKGIKYLKGQDQQPDIIVFLDGDYSDYPEQLPEVIAPIMQNQADLVIGSRALGNRASGSMPIPQVFGNWLATTLMRWFYGARFTDLGPFRAIRWESLMALDMQDKTYGWTVEMQLKAAKHNMRCTEVPVNYKKRIGVSKVSGTIKGTVLAGYKILWTIFKSI